MKRLTVLAAVLTIVFGFVVSAHAVLVDMKDGTIYDTDTQLTWLKDANYAKTSGYDADGLMTWDATITWVESLNAASGFAGFTDWRLPTTTQPDASCSYQEDPGGGLPIQGFTYNCSSEMAHLYYAELGNPAGGILSNVGPFTNLQGYLYWSETPYVLNPNAKWTFHFYTGYQYWFLHDVFINATAVRPGWRAVRYAWLGTDVTLTPTPDITVTFDNVTVEGSLTATENTNPSPPSNFRIPAGSSWDITFDGSFTGHVTVCFSYDEGDVQGNEDNLKLMHNGNSGWTNITLPGYPDTVNNIICGTTDSFSEFAVVEPLSSSPTPVGYNPAWLFLTLLSLIAAGGYILRRKRILQ